MFFKRQHGLLCLQATPDSCVYLDILYIVTVVIDVCAAVAAPQCAAERIRIPVFAPPRKRRTVVALAVAAVLSYAALCAFLLVKLQKLVVNPCLHLVHLARGGDHRHPARQQHGEQRAQRLQRERPERPEQRAAESHAARAVYTGLRRVFVCYIY